MAVYQQNDPQGQPRYMVDFVWVDPKTGRKRRIRRGAKDPKGRPAKSQTAAEKYEHALRSQLAAGTFENTSPDMPTLAGFKERYFKDHVSRLKASSQDYQDRIWRTLLPELGETPLDKIDSEALAKLTGKLQERDLSAKTINNVLSGLRTALSHAEEWKLISSVPRVRWLKVAQAKFAFLDFEEATRLLAAAHGETLGPMLVVAVRTGLRIGELLALKWSDVSLDRKQITVARSVWWAKGGTAHEAGTKNNKVRTVPLTPDALAALESLTTVEPSRRGYVFTDPAGSQLAQSQVKWLLWRVQDTAKLPRTGWHALRHTFCSHLAMRGVPLPAIQQLAGHSTIMITMRYAHLAPDHLRAAIDALG
jgi:integrase